MRVAVGVGGRFHADRLYSALEGAGHQVRLITTFPPSRFPRVPPARVHSVLFPEMLYRLGRAVGWEAEAGAYKIQAFGKALASIVARGPTPDVFVGWSSFSLETLKRRPAGRHLLIRDSAHISFQRRILEAEFRRHRLRMADMGPYEERELAEYEAADSILVLSEFARRTFVAEGIAPEKLTVVPLAVDTLHFRPPESFGVRLPLKVVYFGGLSLRKGVQYLLEATRDFSPSALELTLVGELEGHFRPILAKYPHARKLPPLAHRELGAFLRTQHLFAFPTLEDGFGQTLPQAMAAGLAPLTTGRCGAASAITEGVDGCLVEAGEAAPLRRLLLELTESPARVERIRAAAARKGAERTWEDYARDVVAWAIEKR